MAAKATPKIDVELGRRIIKLKQTHPKLRGLSTFLAVHNACWKQQLADESRVKYVAITERDIREARKELTSSLRQLPKSLQHHGFDPVALFAEHGFPPLSELLKLDDAKLASEAERLRKSLYKKPVMRDKFASFGIRLNAAKLADRLKYRASLATRLAGMPKAATARVKKWKAALAKFRLAAKQAGVTVRGL